MLQVFPQLDGKELRNAEHRLTSDLCRVSQRQTLESSVIVHGSFFST